MLTDQLLDAANHLVSIIRELRQAIALGEVSRKPEQNITLYRTAHELYALIASELMNGDIRSCLPRLAGTGDKDAAGIVYAIISNVFELTEAFRPLLDDALIAQGLGDHAVLHLLALAPRPYTDLIEAAILKQSRSTQPSIRSAAYQLASSLPQLRDPIKEVLLNGLADESIAPRLNAIASLIHHNYAIGVCRMSLNTVTYEPDAPTIHIREAERLLALIDTLGGYGT